MCGKITGYFWCKYAGHRVFILYLVNWVVMQWFSLAFDDFKIPSIILFNVGDLIFGTKTSSQTDKRVKLVKPAKQKERPPGLHGPPRMEWALCHRWAPGHGVGPGLR